MLILPLHEDATEIVAQIPNTAATANIAPESYILVRGSFNNVFCITVCAACAIVCAACATTTVWQVRESEWYAQHLVPIE